jgi:DNA-directed RNA polymerase specialized sigma24 family protein
VTDDAAKKLAAAAEVREMLTRRPTKSVPLIRRATLTEKCVLLRQTGMKYREIADQLGCSVASVGEALRRYRRRQKRGQV